jgi:peptide methionine sulfoxide reductase MsrB
VFRFEDIREAHRVMETNEAFGKIVVLHCFNSASLRFIPIDKLESEGYGVYRKLFDTQEKE